MKKQGTLYGVGVGPGGEELLTLKAVRVIENCDVIIAPSAKAGGVSIAYETAKNFIKDNQEVVISHFPMGKPDKEEKVYDAFKTIEEYLKDGKDVAFLTIGDAFVYSTYIYLLKYIKEQNYKTETVPGITSFCASASIADRILVIGDEPLLIVPGSRIDSIKDEKYVVIMKFYNQEEKVLDFLDERGFDYVCVQRAYREGEKVLSTREEILNEKDYMSLIIAHRNSEI
ncbi:precorrin-2 C20-methyltransferase [Clostridium argentinense CDC 2741]|uniref:Cobalt-precorrin-2 C(20)-methyltransferase n=1 Tax=Clostridium argentinense CDC 2741 TaxID=1418104 RepID=A0A0C1RDU4_9CLOT|nr:cobalt-factor II C(20)-methyltransferase [Clostridium argentinense]ARC84897.1 precorrin-2 C(20)-methyltransferase [Clostridium argentinense]KIE48496.1 precorrin-2 C20-methyltransferase [Clostridium argentinense CDC 2741]NFF40725.1 cobalt-factor II C(20)-methyltransferase [Clostridium argentinense]NFP51928.1 cobalt-factor II C(20)-methyltransferase [Clostridium argentinense]NFP74370.1 cobalt-factor II C(20)-methyltransferase [Clostridium argentinense]